MINKRVFYVLLYKGEQDILDSEGYKTGEKTISYSKPIAVMGNVSGARGSSQVEMFGTDVNYDKTIIISKKLYKNIRITDNSVLFVDKKVQYDNNGLPLYDYRVERIAETLNEVAIAITKVRAD